MAVVDGAKIVLLVLAVTTSVVAVGQSEQIDRVYRIGFLAYGPRPERTVTTTSPLAAFRQTLRERGYVEGKNLILDERWAEARIARLPLLAAELIQLKPDVIVASGATAVRAVMRETSAIPIVIAGAPDPIAQGLISNFARPDANVTGVASMPGRELEGKRLQLLQQAVPGITRVAVILDSTSQLDSMPLQSAARDLGITLLLSGETESPDEFRNAFDEMVRDRADAVYAPETPINVRQRRLLVDLALEYRLPAIYGSRDYVEAGGLMSYGPNYAELFSRAAIYVDRILKGATPGELPVEQPIHFEFVLNNRAAKFLDLRFPTRILMLADEVIR
jgi:putative ABC transport system substrate-binding protein